MCLSSDLCFESETRLRLLFYFAIHQLNQLTHAEIERMKERERGEGKKEREPRRHRLVKMSFMRLYMEKKEEKNLRNLSWLLLFSLSIRFIDRSIYKCVFQYVCVICEIKRNRIHLNSLQKNKKINNKEQYIYTHI